MVSLAARMLVRDVRAGELTVLGLALLIAVAALSSVSMLAERVELGLAQEAHQILGGDLLLKADHPWREEWWREADALGLRTTESILFPSMVLGGASAQLAEIKAVGEAYPLRGHLRIADGLNLPDHEAAGVPARGSVWLDERLSAALSLGPGGQIRLGDAVFTVSAVLTQEPDRGFNVFAIAPRLLMNAADLPATGLIGPGSRVTYRLHLAGGTKAVEVYRHWAEGRLGRGEKLETLDNARPEVRNILERAQRFLRLAALLAVVLAAVAMGLAADRYLRRHLDACAVLRCLGASGNRVLAIHGGAFLLFGAVVAMAGCLVGFALQEGLSWLLAAQVGNRLPAPGWQGWAQGLAVGMTLVAGFSLPPLLRVRQVPAVRVLRREWGEEGRIGRAPVLGTWLAGFATLAILMRWVAADWRLWGIILGGFAIAVLLYVGFARFLLWVASRWAGALKGKGGIGWRYGIANLNRHLRSSLVQMVALGLGLTALLLLTVVRGDLMGAWQSSVPPDAPNRFAINIQPDQQAAVIAFFLQQGLPAPVLEPMVRGRLVAVNGKAIEAESYQDDRARRLVEREFNLSWSGLLPQGNRVSAGQWHGNSTMAQFSVEQGLADTLGLKLGDELVYDIAGVRLAAKITSLRKLDWDSMRVNFFVMTPPGVLENYPASYITSFHLPRQREEVVPALIRRFPNVTLIDVAAVVRQLQDTLDQVARAVQAVFAFALLAGLAVLYAALQSTADERGRELAVLRALGARRPQLQRMLAAEFLVLGIVSGLLAGCGALAIASLLARQLFHLAYRPNPLLLLLGAGAGVLLTLGAGWLGSRNVMHQPPVAALREST
ncbi:MAG: FtsX-like permease family protein [Rhodocyclaceae bacterium]|nr:MAG: FtsX-like permease family protein [Rhodocyclaceae bacterium]